MVLVSLASNLTIGAVAPRWLAGPGEVPRMTLPLAYIRTGFGLIAVCTVPLTWRWAYRRGR